MFSKIKSIYLVLLIYFFLNTFSIYNYGLDVGINIVILETLGYLLLFFCLKWGLKKLINLNGGLIDFLTSFLLFLGIFFSNISQVFREGFLDQAVMLLGLNYRFFDFIIVLGGYLITFYIVTRVVRQVYNYDKFFSVFLLFFLIFSCYKKFNFKSNTISLTNVNHLNDKNTFFRNPDVYYIILDAYTSNKSLESNFGYNNLSFMRALEKRGFFIANDAKSNYNYTSSSTACTLNMSYLNVSDNSIFSANDLSILDSLVEFNRVHDLFKKNGYKLFNYSIFEFNNIKGRPFGISKERQYNSTFLSLVVKGFNKYFSDFNNSKYYHGCYNYNKRAFVFLDSVVKSKASPKFTIIHSLAAHSPFVMDSLGNFVPEQSMNPIATRLKYVNSIKYLNNVIISNLDNILNQPGVKPIIIIQGDHGSHLVNISETSSIFSAYYFPPDYNVKLSKDISPVNSFRVVFQQILNKNISLVNNKNFHISYGNRL